ncbi:MAG: glycosyltransferase family 9 protein [Bacteroidales bacterium]|nr:glycosyltransferase family 9 protein [Bacteroidales bacterium]
MENTQEETEDDTYYLSQAEDKAKGGENAKKFLIIRLSSIGDIVLTTPVVRCLKKQYPNCQIHYLTKQSNACILESNPYINKVHVYNKGLGIHSLINELKKEDFSFIIDLHKNLRSKRIVIALHKPYGMFNKLNFKKWYYVHTKKNVMPNIHIVDRYFDAVKKLNVTNDKEGLDFFLQDEDYISPDALPLSFQDGYITVAVGAKHITKQIPTDILIAVCEKIDGNILLLGDINDKIKANRIENAIGSRVFNGCGAYSLTQTAALIDTSKGIITADTGLMHIAAALKKNIISLWGNTVPEFGMYPYLPKSCKKENHIFEVKNLKCRPCSKLGYKKCPHVHFKCMKQQDTFRIAEIANTWLQDDND